MSTSSGNEVTGRDDQATSPSGNVLVLLGRCNPEVSRSKMSTQELDSVHKEESPLLSDQVDGIMSESDQSNWRKAFPLREAEGSPGLSKRSNELSNRDWLIPYRLKGLVDRHEFGSTLRNMQLLAVHWILTSVGTMATGMIFILSKQIVPRHKHWLPSAYNML